MIVYNVVYFFMIIISVKKTYTYNLLVFFLVVSLLVSVVIKHLSVTLLNSVKGGTIQGWHD